MIIRKAELRDVPRVMELERQSPTAAHWSENDYRAAVLGEGPERWVLVIDFDETDSMLVQFADDSRFAPGEGVRGFAVARRVADEAEIENVVVAAEMRRFGLATVLLERVLETARNRQISRIFLEVRVSNEPARKLYEKAGFRSTGMRKDYYRDPDEDALLLEYIFR